MQEKSVIEANKFKIIELLHRAAQDIACHERGEQYIKAKAFDLLCAMGPDVGHNPYPLKDELAKMATYLQMSYAGKPEQPPTAQDGDERGSE